MSGSAPGGAKVEPNLTPILDMVFQLITFFMLVLNFKAAELDTALQLPVIGSAKPFADDPSIRLLVLNVEVATKCPDCDEMATLQRDLDEDKKLKGYKLHCENGHDTPTDKSSIPNGKTALSVYGEILTKEHRGNHKSISEYLAGEAEISMKGMKEPTTREDIQSGKRELDDIIVIRADTTCPFGAVNDVITECQKQGFRTFALKSGLEEHTKEQQ